MRFLRGRNLIKTDYSNHAIRRLYLDWSFQVNRSFRLLKITPWKDPLLCTSNVFYIDHVVARWDIVVLCSWIIISLFIKSVFSTLKQKIAKWGSLKREAPNIRSFDSIIIILLTTILYCTQSIAPYDDRGK